MCPLTSYSTLSIAEAIRGRRNRLSSLRVNPHLLTPNLQPFPIEIVGAEGAVLRTKTREIMDLCSSTENCILGHNDRWVNASIMAYLLDPLPSFVSSRFINRDSLLLAERLGTIGGIPSAVVNLRQCNGSDVTELAVQAAFQKRRKPLVISFRGSYHGQNLTAFLLSDSHRSLDVWGRNRKLDQFLAVPTVDCTDWKLAAEQTKSFLQEHAALLSALIIEPIQVSSGVSIVHPSFLADLRAFCTENDVALIFDEVQSAGGWLRKRCAAELFEVVPDALALGKALTAGYGPLAALVATRSMGDMPYGSGEKTNGGDLRAVVAANAVWERLWGMLEGDIPQGVDEMLMDELRMGLHSRLSELSCILDSFLVDLRTRALSVGRLQGTDLIRGIEILDKHSRPSSENAKRLHKALLDRNVLLRQHGAWLVIKPPIVIQLGQLQTSLEIVADILVRYAG